MYIAAVNQSLKPLLDSILEEILSLYRDIRHLSDEQILYGSSDKSEKLFLRLDSLITLDLSRDIVCELLKMEELEPVFAQINKFRNLYTVRLEIRYANEILESKSPWDVLEKFPFYENYLRLVLTEYRSFGLKPGNRIIFLGSGPLPLTLIVFFKHYGIRCIGIEQDSARADLSIRTLDKLGLSKNITIVNGNHFSLNAFDFSNPYTRVRAIMIAAQAEPKMEILNHLLKVVPVGLKISYRVYEKGLMKLLNRSILLDPPEGFEEKRIQPDPPAYNTVVVLEKKG